MATPWPVWIASNFWCLLSMLIVLTIASHVALIGLCQIDKAGWKRLDYIWLAVAALALIKVASDARAWWTTMHIPTAESRVKFSLEQLRSVLVDHPPTYLSTEFVRSEFSPPQDVFDEVQRQYRKTWKWVQSLPSVLPEDDSAPFRPLDFAKTEPPQDITDQSVLETIQWIQRLFDEYEQRRNELESLSSQSMKSGGEAMHLVFGPFLLCFALALRITKVTGEIRLEKKT